MPPEEVPQIAEDKILDSRAVWANESPGPDVLEAKCRSIGTRFQGNHDEKLRRDSPWASVQMSHVVCSFTPLLKLELIVADITGAFLQGLPTQRELYVRLQRNLGRCTIPGVPSGSLLKLNKSIYSTNDAARTMY